MYQHHLPSMGKKKKEKENENLSKDQSGMCKSPYQSNIDWNQ